MNILGRLALLFIVVPILELMLLIRLGEVVGLLPTLALVVFTGVTGAWLARAEGLRVFLQFQRELASGRLPGQALMDGICVLIGGAFLLTPGVLTDFAGFSLLFPPTRRWMQRRIRKRLERGIADGSVRVVTMGSFGARGFGFGASDFGGGAAGGDAGADGTVEIGRRPRADGGGRSRPAPPGMDPSKQIVIDEE
jgi:UPF0716 protein FxsA